MYLKKAENKMAFAKVGLYGSAGSGKTFSAAKIAIGLAKADKQKRPVAMFDTEPAASFIIPQFKEAGIEFFVYDESRALKDLMGFLDDAEKQCSVVIIDSITHVWKDVQDSFIKKINETRQKKIYRLEFHHWMPIKNQWAKFTDKFLSSKIHCIVCGRAGSIYEYQTNDETGKKELITSGTKMATEKEMGYEPSLLIEMVKEQVGNKIINRAIVEKDRADKLNGKIIDYPDFEKLKAHFDFINIGGNHFESLSKKDSQDLFTNEGDDDWTYEKKQRTIFLEEIQGFILKVYPSTSVKDKQAKADLIENYFGTRSWTKVEGMNSKTLEKIYRQMKEDLNDPNNNQSSTANDKCIQKDALDISEKGEGILGE